jgi:predicted NAD/FAD-dependent oxidoreductase
MEQEPIAIIGAGIAGLSCAQALRQAGVPVRVFEREGRVGGRCTTRLWQGHLLDDGIPFFTAQSSDFKRELIGRLRQFRPIISPVLDAGGGIVVSPGGPRFYVLQGNNYFAQVMALGLDISLRQPVEKITVREDGIEVLGQGYRAVVSSLPSAETARLLGHDETPADFPACLSALLEYAGLGVGEAAGAYGHVRSDGAGSIAASYCENHKSARIVGPKTVFVVHSSPEFSARHTAEPEEDYLPELVRANDEMWKIPAGASTASFGYRWRMRTRPEPAPEPPRAIFLCGEGKAATTIEDAWRDGRLAAREVLGFLGVQAPAG